MMFPKISTVALIILFLIPFKIQLSLTVTVCRLRAVTEVNPRQHCMSVFVTKRWVESWTKV